MKILFMGTPDFARDSLEKLYDSGYNICGVVTTPDRPAGRGMKIVSSPVKEYAISKNLKVFQPEKIANNTEFKEEIKKIAPDSKIFFKNSKIGLYKCSSINASKIQRFCSNSMGCYKW